MGGQASGSAQPDNDRLVRAGAAINAQTFPRPKLGEILIEAELISDRAFYECLSIAQRSYQPVGHIITKHSYICQQDIDSALLLQSLVANQKMKRQEAVQTLREASLKRVAVVELLKNFQLEEEAINLDANSFAHFLHDCGLINYEQLSAVLQTSSQLNIELVRILIPMNLIDIAGASKVLNALAQVKNGKVEYSKAIFAVQMTNRTGCPLQEALAAIGASLQPRDGRILLGELIARSGVASEIEILAAVEAALVTGQRLGETLLSSGAISLLTLQNALEIQDLLCKGLFERDNAIFVLKHLTSEGASLPDFATKTGLFKPEWPASEEILKLLQLAKLVDEKLIAEALEERACYGMDALRALLASGKLSINIYQAARDICYLIDEVRYNVYDGLNALQACYNEGISLIEYKRANDAKKIEQIATEQDWEDAATDNHTVNTQSTKAPKFVDTLANIFSSIFKLSCSPFKQKRTCNISHRPRVHQPRPLGNNQATYSRLVLDELQERL